MNRILINSLCVVRQCFAVASLLAVFALMSAETAWAQATMQIINNFNSSTPHAAKYFSGNYSDDQVWLYFLNTHGKVTYTNTHSAQKTVQDATSIQLSTVKDGKFNLAIGSIRTKVWAGLGSTNPFSGDNGPGVFDKNVPYALAEWTINGNPFDNTDVSYEDTFSFPTQMTVKNGTTHRATFQPGTQAENVINALEAVMPNKPVGPHNHNYPTAGSVGWGPLVPTVSGKENANRWIGSSKFWISGPDPNKLRSMYIYAPSLNDYLKYLKDNETFQFKNGIKGWYIDYSGNGGYSGYLSITGSSQSYGLRIHDIRVNAGGSAPNWKADPTAGTATTGEITVTANNATITYLPVPSNKVIGPWTDAVIYSGAALLGGLGGGPVVTGTDDFATSGAQKAIVPTMLASISASIATGLLGSKMYKDKIKDYIPGATMYWFNTLTRAQSTQKLFEKAWSPSQKFYDPFWKTMAEFTNMQGYLSPFNDRWAHFSPGFPLGKNYTITWELGLATSTSVAVIDIKPGSSPNTLDVNSTNRWFRVRVAILGTDNFDVNNIDLNSVLLEGLQPLRSYFRDVSTPFSNGGPDGKLDLLLKFSKNEVIAFLGEVSNGDCVEMTLTGQLVDGNPISGSDHILVKTTTLAEDLGDLIRRILRR